MLHGYLDRQLDLRSMLAIETHLSDCDSCRQEWRALSKLNATLKQGITYHRAPEGLRQRLKLAIEPPRTNPKWFGGLFYMQNFGQPLAGLALLLLGFALGWQYQPAKRESRQTDELLAAHVRSLQADHLTDVASSDQHTVKPWFNGKLDFAPQVLDFTAQGFPLVGGRLDYLDSKPVSALIYRRRQHLINVFVRPESQEPKVAESNVERQGFHVLNFSAKGMDYSLVSDLNPQELQELELLLKQPPN
jgi:anti-sigma factor RsiW